MGEIILFDLHQTDTVPVDGPLTPADIDLLVSSLPQRVDGRIARAKGVFDTVDGAQVLVQMVGTRYEVTELLPSERQETTDLVVISLR